MPRLSSYTPATDSAPLIPLILLGPYRGLRCEPLASLVRDDLGRYLVLLSAKRELPPIVLQSVLGLVSTLIASMAPCLRVLVECIFQHVFLKALHQLHQLLQVLVSISVTELACLDMRGPP